MVQTLDIGFLRHVFTLHSHQVAGQAKIDFEGLMSIFKMINFQPNEAQLQFYREAFRSKEGDIALTFNSFENLFKLKIDKSTKVHNKNCFRILTDIRESAPEPKEDPRKDRETTKLHGRAVDRRDKHEPERQEAEVTKISMERIKEVLAD